MCSKIGDEGMRISSLHLFIVRFHILLLDALILCVAAYSYILYVFLCFCHCHPYIFQHFNGNVFTLLIRRGAQYT